MSKHYRSWKLLAMLLCVCMLTFNMNLVALAVSNESSGQTEAIEDRGPVFEGDAEPVLADVPEESFSVSTEGSAPMAVMAGEPMLVAAGTLNDDIPTPTADGDVAQISGTSYPTLAAAIEAATDGDIVELLQDVALEPQYNDDGTAAPLAIDKAVTITSAAGGPYTLRAAQDAQGYLLNITAEGTVTFKNIVIDGGSEDGLTGNRAMIAMNGTSVTSTTLVLDEGTVLQNNCNTVSGGAGGAVCVVAGTLEIRDGSKITNNTSTYGAISAPTANGCIVMSGGEISGNHAAGPGETDGRGGAVCMLSSGSFTMSGGTIKENRAVNYGGAIYAQTNSSVTISGGSIESNTAGTYGGGIQAQSGSAVTISAGSIKGNTAGAYGGGVYITTSSGNSSTITMTGGSITGNTAGVAGGVYAGTNVTFTMSAGSISANKAIVHLDSDGDTAGGFGGGVYVSASAQFDMTGGEIAGNEAQTYAYQNDAGETAYKGGTGGGVYCVGTFTLSDGSIANNTSRNAGGMYAGGVGTVTMTGGSISGNHADHQGGGVDVGTLFQKSSFIMRGGEISENYAKEGGGIFASETYYIEISGGKIVNNTAGTHGGGFFTAPARSDQKDDVVIVFKGSPYIYDNVVNQSTYSNYDDNFHMDGFKEDSGMASARPDVYLGALNDDAKIGFYAVRQVLYFIVMEAEGDHIITTSDLVKLNYADKTYEPNILTMDGNGTKVYLTAPGDHYGWQLKHDGLHHWYECTCSAENTSDYDGHRAVKDQGEHTLSDWQLNDDGKYERGCTFCDYREEGENNPTIVNDPVISIDTSKVDGITDEDMNGLNIELSDNIYDNVAAFIDDDDQTPTWNQAAGVDGIDGVENPGDIHVHVEVKFDVVVEDLRTTTADNGAVRKEMDINITPYYRVWALTHDEKLDDIEGNVSDENSIQGIILSLEEGDDDGWIVMPIVSPVKMTLPVGAIDAEEGTMVDIDHHHNETVYSYSRKVIDGAVTFTNPHGFSVFTLSIETAAGLDSLLVKDSKTQTEYPLNPDFDTDVTDYETTVPNSVDKVNVQPTTPDGSGYTITVNGKAVNSGDWSNEIDLEEGWNEIRVIVTDGIDPADGGLEDTIYTIRIYREPADNSNDPNEPSDPTTPDEPNDPSDPTTPEGPTEPSDPTTPDGPTEPSDPTTPDGPTEPSDPTTPDGPTKPSDPTESDDPTESSAPNTGDESHFGLWLLLMLLSLTGMVITLFSYKRITTGKQKRA